MATVTLKCTCGGRSRILTSKAIAAGWTDKGYKCDDCGPVLRDESVDPELERLQREPVDGNLAVAL